MSRLSAACAPLRMTVTIAVDTDELVAAHGAGERLESTVAGLLKLYPGARVSVAHELVEAPGDSDPSSQE